VQRIERPKSVPPNMFEALQNQENVNNRPTEVHNKGTPPKPPPRRSREPGLTTGRVSLLPVVVFVEFLYYALLLVYY
jgi:hypothetical protein